MISAKKLQKLIDYSIKAHNQYAKKHYKRFRLHDKKTPFSIHPVWAAMMLLHEPFLPEQIRIHGAPALLLHDIIEDTTASLPKGISRQTKKLINELTFLDTKYNKDGTEKIYKRSDWAQLLELYDSLSNFMDGTWIRPNRRRFQKKFILKLSKVIKKKFGKLNIVICAMALCGDKHKKRYGKH